MNSNALNKVDMFGKLQHSWKGECQHQSTARCQWREMLINSIYLNQIRVKYLCFSITLIIRKLYGEHWLETKRSCVRILSGKKFLKVKTWLYSDREQLSICEVFQKIYFRYYSKDNAASQIRVHATTTNLMFLTKAVQHFKKVWKILYLNFITVI